MISEVWPGKSLASLLWGFSSAGRARRWQRRGQRFDPAKLHQFRPYVNLPGLLVKLLAKICILNFLIPIEYHSIRNHLICIQ